MAGRSEARSDPVRQVRLGKARLVGARNSLAGVAGPGAALWGAAVRGVAG